MKLAIVFDAYEKMGGGYFHSLQTAKLIKKLEIKNLDISIIPILPGSEKQLKEENFRILKFNKLTISRIFFYLSQSRIIDFVFTKLKINNPFTNFLLKNKFDLVFFLGPSFYINCCNNINFIVNLFDLNYKFNNFFPEYKKENIFKNTEALIKKSIDRAFKILVDTKKTKEDLTKYLGCLEEKIDVYPFSSSLPELSENKEKNKINQKFFENINLKKDDEFIFYPAQFWGHKNHRYIIDTMDYLKKNKLLKFKCVFCGTDKGNLNFIKKLIKEKNLQDNFVILGYLTDSEIITLYRKSKALVMPTYVARSTLPLYEAFYFKVPIFYSKNVLDPNLENLVTAFDLNDYKDLASKLINFDKEKQKFKVEKSFEYFEENCSNAIKIDILKNLLEQYKYFSQRWT